MVQNEKEICLRNLGDGVAEFFGMGGVVPADGDDLGSDIQKICVRRCHFPVSNSNKFGDLARQPGIQKWTQKKTVKCDIFSFLLQNSIQF